jgi:hypothetical protein
LLYSIASKKEVERYFRIFSAADKFAVIKVGGAILTYVLPEHDCLGLTRFPGDIARIWTSWLLPLLSSTRLACFQLSFTVSIACRAIDSGLNLAQAWDRNSITF